MKTLTAPISVRMLTLPVAVAIAMGAVTVNRGAYAQQMGRDQVQTSQVQATYSQRELDQMLAPIALYPDSLLSQILMAATYPLEVVQAARWSRANPDLDGDDAVRAVADQDWDASVQSLVAFPQILSMMEEKLDWTETLGDAFLAQEPHVMDTIQTLRQRAQAAGNLRTTEYVRVEQQGPIILVEPANPQLVYLPYYDPTVIYGAWWWPTSPPVYWRPWRGYAARPGIRVGFYWGSGVRLATDFFFGRFDWSRRNVNVVRANYYNTAIANRGAGNRVDDQRWRNGTVQWRHDPQHRRGLAYQDPAVRRQFTATAQRPYAEQRRDESWREAAPGSRRAAEARNNEARDDGRYNRSRMNAYPAEAPRISGAAPAAAPRAETGQAPARWQNGERQRRQEADAQPNSAAPVFRRSEARAAAPAVASPIISSAPPPRAEQPHERAPRQFEHQAERPRFERQIERQAERQAERPRVERQIERQAERPRVERQIERQAAAPRRDEVRPERQARRDDQAARSANGGSREGRNPREQRNPAAS